jgi:hypothetical protein
MGGLGAWIARRNVPGSGAFAAVSPSAATSDCAAGAYAVMVTLASVV